MFSSFSFGLDLIFFTPPDWIFSRVDCDKLDLIAGDLEFFLNNLGFGDRTRLAVLASLDVDKTLGVDKSLEAERSLGDDVLADMLSRWEESFF